MKRVVLLVVAEACAEVQFERIAEIERAVGKRGEVRGLDRVRPVDEVEGDVAEADATRHRRLRVVVEGAHGPVEAVGGSAAQAKLLAHLLLVDVLVEIAERDRRAVLVLPPAARQLPKRGNGLEGHIVAEEIADRERQVACLERLFLPDRDATAVIVIGRVVDVHAVRA